MCGAILGGELVAGVSVAVSVVGWLAGAAIGSLLGYWAGLPTYQSFIAGEDAPRTKRINSQVALPDYEVPTRCDHVARLMEERNERREAPRER